MVIATFHPFSLVTRQNSEEIEETMQKTLFIHFPSLTVTGCLAQHALNPWLQKLCNYFLAICRFLEHVPKWFNGQMLLKMNIFSTDSKSFTIIYSEQSKEFHPSKQLTKVITSQYTQYTLHPYSEQNRDSTLSKKARKAITSQVRNLSNRLPDCCLLLSKSHPRNKKSLVMDFILKY